MKTIDSRELLSDLDFSRQYFRNQIPVCIKGGMKQSKTCKLWTPDYLKKIIGNKLTRINQSIGGIYGHHQGMVESIIVPFDEAVSLFLSKGHQNGAYYLQQSSIKKDFPELLKDLEYPKWILNTDLERATNIWFGSGGCVSPLHFDTSQNFLLQIFGSKLVTLIAPTDSQSLYPDYLSQHRHISNVDPENPDYQKYPLFKGVKLFKCLLEPGDVLYIPINWWHHVRSLNVSISVNFWWKRLELIEGVGLEVASVEVLKTIIQEFLSQGTDINMKDFEGETLLLKASNKGYGNIVEALLQLGADPYIKSEFLKLGSTAISLAEERGHMDVARKLQAYMTDKGII